MKRGSGLRRADRRKRGARLVALGFALVAAASGSAAPATAASPASPASSAVPPAGSRGAAAWINVPRVAGRLTAADIGLVINTADPYSVAVGAHYIAARKLAAEQVLRVELPAQATLSPDQFSALRQRIEAHFGDATQALALAWTVPYAVQCQSITGALALGFDPTFCSRSCEPSKPSTYFNSASSSPWRDHHLRPSMQLAARDVEAAGRLIDRGVAADRSQGLRGAPPVHVYFLSTGDAARSVRSRLFPPAGPLRRAGVEVHVEANDRLRDKSRLLLVETGLAQVSGLDTLKWVDGALADHLTSYGGQLDKRAGQTTALAWLESGATASYGTVSEPCNHVQKFPHPQVLLLHYLQGESAIEAYWKSVAWPLQGVFVGEPLAAPFARR